MPSVTTGSDPPRTRYHVHTGHVKRSQRGSLMDRGANGGILGSDARVTFTHQRFVDVTGIDNHELNALKLVDASAIVDSQHGPVIVILRQYAYHGRDRTIHSCGQIEFEKNRVHDRSMKVGGFQHIHTMEGYIIPLDVINGLVYMRMSPNTDKEFAELPHVVLTPGNEWDPRVLDHILTDKEDWYDTLQKYETGFLQSPFDVRGNYIQREPETAIQLIPPIANDENDMVIGNGENPQEANRLCIRACFHDAANIDGIYTRYEQRIEPLKCYETETVKKPRETKPKRIDYKKYRPYFLHVSADKVRATFKSTTQFATNVGEGHFDLRH